VIEATLVYRGDNDARASYVKLKEIMSAMRRMHSPAPHRCSPSCIPGIAMDLHQLEMFRAVAEEGSFTKAAEHPHLSQWRSAAA
jgi:hypothetical protein